MALKVLSFFEIAILIMVVSINARNTFSMEDSHIAIKPTAIPEQTWDAVARGDSNGVKRAIEHIADLNETNSGGWTLLHEAAGRGHTEIVLTLIAAGADVNSVNFTAYGGLLARALRVSSYITGNWKFQQHVVRMAVTALHRANTGGHLEVVKILIRSGADLSNLADLPTVQLAMKTILEKLA